MGRIIPNVWTNKKWSKAPTSSFNGTYQKLVGGFKPSWKVLINGKDYSQYMDK